LILEVSKLNLCAFFCNYSQKNDNTATSWHGIGRYICEPDYWSINGLFGKLKAIAAAVMIDIVFRIQRFFEVHAFGVCATLAERLGVATSSVRLFFIYASFITFGSPVIVYLALAFVMNMRKHLRKRNPIWDY